MLTILTPLAQFLATEGIEGFRLQTYDDKTGDRLDEGEVAEGKASIAVGLIKYADGTPVEPGDELTLQEAWDETYHYLNKVLEPSLDRILNVVLPDNKLMAFASWLYNFGETKARKYSLPRLINERADDYTILEKWQEYIIAGGKPQLGLYRRRLAECLMWLDYDWRPALNADWDTSLSDLVEAAGGEPIEPIVDQELFDEFEIPTRGKDVKREKGSDPTPETPMTIDDAQFLSAEAAGYDGTYADFMSHRTVVTTRNAIEAPKIDVKKPPKPMEDSKTHRGLAKKTAGKEGRDAGAILAGAGSVAGAMNSLSKNTAQTVENAEPLIAGFTFNHIIILAMVAGFGLLIYGAWRMYRGEMIAREGREDGTQLKV